MAVADNAPERVFYNARILLSPIILTMKPGGGQDSLSLRLNKDLAVSQTSGRI